MRKLSLVGLFFLFTLYGYTQENTEETPFWKLTSINGEFNLNGAYLTQEIRRNSFYEKITRSYLSGGLFFNSRSYFWHPNFMTLSLDAGYSPETGQQLSLVAPDRAEVNTLKKLNASVFLFQNNKMNFKVYTNLHEGYSNRENLTNIRSKSINWGSIYNYNNKLLPFSILYNQTNNEQTELATERTYIIDNANLQGRVSKSFGSKDNHQFIVSQNSYVYDDKRLNTEHIQLNNQVKNDITRLSLNNTISFDSTNKYRFNSTATYENQIGSYFNYKRLQIIENLSLKLPWKFNFTSNYSYFDIETNTDVSKQHNVRGVLSHQLFESLRTSATLEYHDIISSQYLEKNRRARININYVKKIPLKGLLSVSYSLRSNHQDRSNENALISIQNEEYRITDSQMVLLLEQNVNAESVIVKDETGTIIYQLFLDYILIERNELLEIQRIPGGQIEDDSIVFIDYMATQPSSYKYNAIHNYFMANVSLFNNKISLYFKTANQDFINPENIEFLTLDYFNQKVYGARINFKFINGGVEQDNFESTIIPYRLTRYYLILQGNFKQKLLFTLNGTARDYQMIIEEGNKQQFYNLTGTVGYFLGKKTKLNILGSYLKQNGEGINLDLLTSRVELSTRFLQIYMKASFELYKSKFYTEQLDYNKFAIQISRKF